MHQDSGSRGVLKLVELYIPDNCNGILPVYLSPFQAAKNLVPHWFAALPVGLKLTSTAHSTTCGGRQYVKRISTGRL